MDWLVFWQIVLQFLVGVVAIRVALGIILPAFRTKSHKFQDRTFSDSTLIYRTDDDD